MAFDLLTSLDPTARRAILLVRVSRKWEYRGGTDDGPIQHVDLVLIDTQGNAMYAEIPGTEVEAKSHLVEEGGVYIISRFRVSNAKHSFRPVAGSFMIEFTCHTHVSAPREAVPAIPFLTYRLTAIEELKSHAGDTRDFVDVIGILTEVSDSHFVRLPNKPRPTLTRHIILRSQSYSEIKVSLWGERASSFTIDQTNGGGEGRPVVVLLVGCLMKKYQDNYYLSANTAARWYFNPEIPEAGQFINSFQDQHAEVRRVAAPAELESQRSVSMEQEFKTLEELNAMDPYDYADNGYRVVITIGRLVPNVSWWFASCTRCSKSCMPDGARYKCGSCSSDSFRFKYKICFVAFDGTGEAEMICFGDVARYLVGKPVQQVLRATTPATPVPADISRIVTRRFTLAVNLTKQSFYRQAKTFQVTSVLTVHGQNDVLPVAPNGGTSPSSSQSTLSPSPTPTGSTIAPLDAADSQAGSILSAGTPSTAVTGVSLSPLALSGPSSSSAAATTPTLQALNDGTPVSKLQSSDKTGDDKRSSARRKILGDDYTEETDLAIDDCFDKEPATDASKKIASAEKKRTRTSRVSPA